MEKKKLFDFGFQFFDERRESFNVAEEDPEGGSSDLFGSAKVDRGLSGFNQRVDFFEVEIISFDRADDFLDLLKFGLGKVLNRWKFLKDGEGSDGERVFQGCLLMFGEDDGEKRKDLTLIIFTFFDQLITQLDQLSERLNKLFGDLTLDVFSGS